ncbi:MAG: hypothetical protein NHG36_01215, partial [Chromatiaceae bacterium]|nr:hypothetical protein [Candidatus Thioaporhodococcus sediminis]
LSLLLDRDTDHLDGATADWFHDQGLLLIRNDQHSALTRIDIRRIEVAIRWATVGLWGVSWLAHHKLEN